MNETLTTVDGVDLALYRWTPDRPARGTVQLVHGLGEHCGRYGSLATALVAAGWRVIGHDHRGHGRSGGPRGGLPVPDAMLRDLALVIDALREPGPHVLLGHSMGGAIAGRFVAEALAPSPAAWSRPVDGLVLSSPALDPGLDRARTAVLAVLGGFAPLSALNNGLKPEWLSRDPAVVRAYVEDPLNHAWITPRLARMIVDDGRRVRDAAPRWRTPTLLMWAGDDRCVAPRGSEAFARAAPAGIVESQAWPALRHEIFNEPERDAVIGRLLDWLGRLAR